MGPLGNAMERVLTGPLGHQLMQVAAIGVMGIEPGRKPPHRQGVQARFRFHPGFKAVITLRTAAVAKYATP